MKPKVSNRTLAFILLIAALLAPVGLNSRAAAPPPSQADQVNINGFFSVYPIQQGSTFQPAIVLDIHKGMYVLLYRPIGKYAVPMTIKVEAPRGFKVTPIVYPAGNVCSVKFCAGAPEQRLSVYEGHSIARFNVTVPPDYPKGGAQVGVTVQFQSCNDQSYFPPSTRALTLPINVVGRDTPMNHINGQYFGGGNSKRRS